MIRLHGYFRSSAAFRTRIALNLKGLDYDQSFIHLRKNEQSGPAYLARNPQGLVPLLEADGGVALIQSLAIIEYLDETHPRPPLLPKAPADRARARALAQIVACDIHPLGNLRVLRYLAKPLGQDEKAVEAWFNHWIKLGFDAIEPMLADPRSGKFCHGDEPGLADICLVPQIFNAKRYPSFDMKPYPAIQRIFDNCMRVAAFERARPENQPDAEK
jgi:maleylpyruvate isomerase